MILIRLTFSGFQCDIRYIDILSINNDQFYSYFKFYGRYNELVWCVSHYYTTFWISYTHNSFPIVEINPLGGGGGVWFFFEIK
jgi:hypothetical protein